MLEKWFQPLFCETGPAKITSCSFRLSGLQVYLFVASQRIAGCLVAEPIKEAFQIISFGENRRAEGAAVKDTSKVSCPSIWECGLPKGSSKKRHFL